MMRLLFSLCILPISLFCNIKNENPIKQVKMWFKEEKEKTEGRFFQFATLATTSADGQPHTRIIEMVRFNSKQGGLFFTHKNSAKVGQLSYNPKAALNIWLPKTLRQVSMEGVTKEIPSNESEKFWKQMPRFMQLTFLASSHCEEIESLDVLQRKKEKLSELYKNDIPMPDSFIGYRFIPEKIIFFTVQTRDFPIKQIASLCKDHWEIALYEP